MHGNRNIPLHFPLFRASEKMQFGQVFWLTFKIRGARTQNWNLITPFWILLFVTVGAIEDWSWNQATGPVSHHVVLVFTFEFV
jgi:hypothetical protein